MDCSIQGTREFHSSPLTLSTSVSFTCLPWGHQSIKWESFLQLEALWSYWNANFPGRNNLRRLFSDFFRLQQKLFFGNKGLIKVLIQNHHERFLECDASRKIDHQKHGLVRWAWVWQGLLRRMTGAEFRMGNWKNKKRFKTHTIKSLVCDSQTHIYFYSYFSEGSTWWSQIFLLSNDSIKTQGKIQHLCNRPVRIFFCSFLWFFQNFVSF